jgi:hypothetical protein
MMTRTCAQELSTRGIFMTSVDTGWINEENPLHKGAAHAAATNFQVQPGGGALPVLVRVYGLYKAGPATISKRFFRALNCRVVDVLATV